MHYRLLVSIVALALSGLATSARPQDAGKVMDEYLKATGGSKVLSKIQTLALEGTSTSTGDGKPGTYTLNLKLPNRYYSELLISDTSLIEAYNGKSAWHRSATGELATLVGAEGAQLEAAGQYYNSRFLNPKKMKLGLAFLGHAQVHGKDALQIEVTTPSNLKREVFFDPQTHLIVEEAAIIGGIDQQIFYDDYRTIEHLKLPYKIELRRGSETYHIAITRAAVNESIGERVFDFPKKSQVQLPDLKALFNDIDANQKAIDKMKENYAGTRTEEETQFDKAWKVTKRELKEYTFFYLNGQEVSTLSKKDGKPLSEEENRRENDKTHKEIHDIQNKQAKKEAKDEKAKEQGKQQKDDEDVGIETFLQSSQFVNPRRERFRGKDVLVFDFEPNPDFKPRKMAERLIQKLAGIVWIDEQAHDVARLEAYFVGDFKLGGGLLANLQKGTSFVFEQAYVNNEVWLPTYEEAHVGARILLVKGIKVNSVTHYSDYKKFNVESIGTIGKPKTLPDEPGAPAPNSAPSPPEQH
jgi:hypothetical protein